MKKIIATALGQKATLKDFVRGLELTDIQIALLNRFLRDRGRCGSVFGALNSGDPRLAITELQKIEHDIHPLAVAKCVGGIAGLVAEHGYLSQTTLALADLVAEDGFAEYVATPLDEIRRVASSHQYSDLVTTLVGFFPIILREPQAGVVQHAVGSIAEAVLEWEARQFLSHLQEAVSKLLPFGYWCETQVAAGRTAQTFQHLGSSEQIPPLEQWREIFRGHKDRKDYQYEFCIEAALRAIERAIDQLSRKK